MAVSTTLRPIRRATVTALTAVVLGLLLSSCHPHCSEHVRPRTAVRLEVREVDLGPSDYQVHVSPNLRRAACVIGHFDGPKRVVVDGEPGNPYRRVGVVTFSPDSERFSYVAEVDDGKRVIIDGEEGPVYDDVTGPTWSPDSKRFAYAARRGDEQFAVVDGRQGPAHGRVDGSYHHGPGFSPDSRHVYYAVKEGDKWRVVVDGDPGPPYDEVHVSYAAWSPDSQHFFYTAWRGDTALLVLDGTEYPVCEHRASHFVADGHVPAEFAGSIAPPFMCTFSPDSTRLVYTLSRAVRWPFFVRGISTREYLRETVVTRHVDGSVEVGRPYELIYNTDFSPDGRRLGYVAERNGRMVAVVDGQEDTPYDWIEGGYLTFSPDSEHVAYAAEENGRWFAIADGVEGPSYDLVWDVLFSHDSRHVAYRTQENGLSRAVIDGREGRAYPKVGFIGPSAWSPDGRRVAYAASPGGDRWLVVVDGREGPVYDDIHGGPVFTPDSRHVVWVALRNEEWFAVVDGTETRGYDHFSYRHGDPSYVAFDGPDRLRAIGERDGRVYRLEIRIVEAGEAERTCPAQPDPTNGGTR